jgi:hypothetical protein
MAKKNKLLLTCLICLDKFNDKAVKVYNEILLERNHIISIDSIEPMNDNIIVLNATFN